MAQKYRIHEVAKDFGVPNKYVLDALAELGGPLKNHMTALEDHELNYFFDVISREHAVKSFEPYFKEGEEKRSQSESAKVARAEKARAESIAQEVEQRRKDAAAAELEKQRIREEMGAALAKRRGQASQSEPEEQQVVTAARPAASAPRPLDRPTAPAAASEPSMAPAAPAPAVAAVVPAPTAAPATPVKPMEQARPQAPSAPRPVAPQRAPGQGPATSGQPGQRPPLRPNTNTRPAGAPPAGQSVQPTARPAPGQRPSQGPQDRRPPQVGQQGQRPPQPGQRPAQGTSQGPSRSGQGQRPAQPSQRPKQPPQNRPAPQPRAPQQTTRREGVRVVDTRAGSVDLAKFDERYAQMAPEKASRMGGGKARVGKRGSGSRGQTRGGVGPRRETEAERLKRLELEKARLAPLHITISDEIVVSELATRLKKTNAEVVKRLVLMGDMVSANDTIDFDTAALVADEFGALYTREVVVTIEERLFDVTEDSDEDLEPRDPIVVVMGHVDHGKTSLLDAIRNTNVTAGEAGGITQHIGAYKVAIADREITFLDTPGHAAFTSMRARGTNVTDIAILVIAADDGIMPQTIEAINHAKAANVAIIVAINKIDKASANIERVKQELTEYGLVPEEWGGDVICVPVSAVTREGIDTLLEMVILQADIRELRANPARRGSGTVIEAELDKSRGPVVTLLVQNGTLRASDVLIAGTAVGRVRAMTDDKGRRIKEAGPSTPVEITGLAEVPQAGDVFHAVDDEKMARELADQRRVEVREAQVNRTKISLDDLFSQIQMGDIKELNLIVKADVQGSAEAVKASLEKLSGDEVKVKVIHSGVGAINGSDLMLAEVSNAIVIGFNVRPDSAIRDDAQQRGIDIRTYRIIYECIEEMEAAMRGLLDPKFREVVQGQAEVRQIFRVSGVGTVAGCMVKEGKIFRSSLVRVLRDSVVVAETKLDSLRRFKDDVREVNEGYECGIGLERFNDIKEGDIIEAYMMEEYRP